MNLNFPSVFEKLASMHSEIEVKRDEIKFEGIDGLRFFLVLGVIFHHFFLSRNPETFFSSELRTISDFAYLAVRFFFVVSGFLIFHKMKFIHTSSNKPILSFYKNRFFKIFPLWWFTVALYCTLYRFSLENSLLYTTFIFGFVGYKIFLIPHAWSLFVEEIFYLFFPWLYKKLMSIKMTFFLFVLFYIISIIWLRYAKQLGVPANFWFIEFSPLANFHYFFLGITIYHLVSLHLLKYFDAVFKYRIIEAAVMVLLLFLFFKYGHFVPEVFIFLFFLIVLNLKSSFSKFLSCIYFGFSGKAVYPIYLVHFICIDFFVRFLNTEVGSNLSKELNLFSFYIEIGVLFVLTTLCGTIIHLFFEIPIIKIGKKIDFSR